MAVSCSKCGEEGHPPWECRHPPERATKMLAAKQSLAQPRAARLADKPKPQNARPSPKIVPTPTKPREEVAPHSSKPNKTAALVKAGADPLKPETDKPKFDRNAYQKAYMRQRRAKLRSTTVG